MFKRIRFLLPGEHTGMIIISAFIGLMAGVLVIVFRESIHFVHENIFIRGYELLRIDEGGWRRYLLPLIPMFGMLLLIPLSLMFPGEVNGYGFPKFLRKVNLENGVFKPREIFIKIISTSLTIGSGNSAGMEGPIAAIGGTVGSLIGQQSRVSGRRLKVYVAAGCAGGIAGIFNAPLAGMFFAAEIVLLGTYEIASFSALVIASAFATVVSRWWYGETPIFPIPDFHMVSPWVEMPLYALMATIIGVLAVLHIKCFYFVRDKFQAMPVNKYVKPIMGAFIVGCIGIYFPQVMGDGYEYIAEVLHGEGLIYVMLVLIVLKSVATAITIGSGGAGGVFAPSLFIGAFCGGSFGALVHNLLPSYTAGPGAYATIGIGAFLAASTHAPMTAIFLLFEMTGNHMVIVPAMLACILSVITAGKLYDDSIDTVDFSREGINIHEGREVAIMKSLKVGKAITEEVDFISENANVDHLLKLFRESAGSFYFPVIDHKGMMVGIVSMQDVKNILHDEEQRECFLVGGICTRDVISLTPDDNLYDAMHLFDIKGLEEIPVVESREEPWVLGMLKRRDVIDAYNHEILKRGISEKEESIRMLCSSS